MWYPLVIPYDTTVDCPAQGGLCTYLGMDPLGPDAHADRSRRGRRSHTTLQPQAFTGAVGAAPSRRFPSLCRSRALAAIGLLWRNPSRRGRRSYTTLQPQAFTRAVGAAPSRRFPGIRRSRALAAIGLLPPARATQANRLRAACRSCAHKVMAAHQAPIPSVIISKLFANHQHA
jgi:hypothetical protein